MKQLLFTAILSILFLVETNAQKIPISTRSKKAKTEKTPALKKAYNKKGLTWSSSIFIRIFKESKDLEIWVKKGNTFKLFKTYDICTYGGQGLGPKLKEGDGMAPEGFYYITRKSLNPYSNFYLSFNLGYPNTYDRAYKRTGSALMVHGSCVSIGCYAMTDTGIKEIYTIVESALRSGQSYIRIHIFPFKMTDTNIAKHKTPEWKSFWENLKTGYDLFEKSNVPPNVSVKNKKYIFN